MQQKSELLEGWIWTEVKNLGILINGDRGKNYPSNRHYVDSGIPFINAGNLFNGKVSTENLNFISDERYNLLNSGKLIEGDIIYCLRGTLGKCAVFSGMKNGAIASSLVILRLNEATINSYMYYFLTSPFGKKLIKTFDNGTAQPNLSAKSLSSYPVPLPPLPEQHRIVAAIEALFARLDATNERLDKVPEIMKAFRQAVLMAACDGRLTEDWRLHNSDIESAKTILEYITTDKSKLSKKKQTKDAICDVPYELPTNWCWTCIDLISESMKNGIYKPQEFYSDDGIACLRMYNIDNGAIVWKNIKRMNLSSEEIAEYLLEPGDILVNRVNSRELVGKAAPIPNGIEACIYESKNIRLRVFKQYILSEYIGYWFQVYAQGYFNLNAQQTVNMASINQQQLASMPLPFPPLAEQKEIIFRVSALFAFADSIESKVIAAKEKTDQLRQSILAKAFSGELVPTEAELARQEDRDYESAEMLLERIKVEGASIKKQKK
ncbi:restriction endonuclease subunit S [Methanolobus chelungpuianus]|uniref:restriction endonuclease subunit S n=1 Tax=Methanolobus chelungpuianus TaxID=502115 RepID=UPI00211529F3|nr:restriction endonuclease subunit S [Methanolobus chelungpuianus]